MQATILPLFAELRDQLGLAILLISHNLAVVRHLSDRVAVMYLGRIVESVHGTLFDDPRSPYTQVLLEAAPRLSQVGRTPRRRSRAIRRASSTSPRGAAFTHAVRGPRDVCKTDDPPLFPVDGDQMVDAAPPTAEMHRAACHFRAETGERGGWDHARHRHGHAGSMPRDGYTPHTLRTRLSAAREDFLRRYPDYAGTGVLDELRAAEYGRLDRQGHTYLDYTGGSLYAESQLRRHCDLLHERVLGNPHSHNPTSAASTQARRRGACGRAPLLQRRAASTTSSSRRTPPGRCDWSASPIPSGPAASTC